MSVLRFESEEALRFTITSGLVPSKILEGAARTWRDEGAIIIEPDGSVSPDAMKALAAAGVGRLPNGTKSAKARDVSCWAEIVPPVRARSDFDPEGTVLFHVPEESSLVGLAGELVRLGCDRLEYRPVEGGHLLRANAPPYYSVLRAIDGTGTKAFVATPPGQDRVWLAAGYEHPFSRFLRPRKDSLVLIGADEWTAIPDGEFTDIYALIDLEVPGAKRRRLAATDAPRVPVPLRLAHASALDAPSLWVVRDDAATKIERLVAALPEETTRGLLFAAHDGPKGVVIVVRLRPGRVMTMEIDGEPYRAHPAIANLFLPVAATLEPPLRRDRLRDLFTPDPDEVVWLRAGAKGAFTVESTSDAAFVPLTSFIDYVIDRDRERLVPWVRSATFDFQTYVGEPEASETRDPAPKRGRKEKAPEPEPSAPEILPEPVRPRAAAAPVPQQVPARLAAAQVDTNRIAEELAAVERAFLVLESAADSAERLGLWSRMAVLHTMLRHGPDASLSWTRVIWERSEDASVKSAWAEAESLIVHNASTQTLLALVDPSRDHVRAVTSRIVAGGDPVLQERVQDVSLWLEQHEDQLDVRGAWLARLALSRAVGGDRLGLARARDRLLSRIHGGLSLERDVPAFLRRAGRSRDSAQIDVLAQRVDALPAMLASSKRKRSATEADPALTTAYVKFVVAYGLARLGRIERAHAVRDEAIAALPAADPIHRVLVRAFQARVAQALEALPAETALPAEVSQQLGALVKLERYKVDRVRQASKVLEPQERLDPIAAFQRGEADPRGPEFAALRTEADPGAIDRMVHEIIHTGESAPPDTKARLYDGAMDFFPSLRHERAHGLLATVVRTSSDIPPVRRVQVLEEALMLAGHFGEEALAREILTVLEPSLAQVGGEGAAAIAPVAAGMLRTLRRFGLRDAAERMLGLLQVAAAGKGTPSLIARLHTAAALSFLGQTDKARPVFEEALGVLRTELPMGERLQLGRALSRALATAPIEYALAGMAELEKGVVFVTDSFNTNTHVCLSVLDFMEALVLGYANEDLSIDPAIRRHLDDDEYLVRRRIHKDLK
ncbi:MAG: hypothetical protein U0270_09745 [Labilithrix sp.]